MPIHGKGMQTTGHASKEPSYHAMSEARSMLDLAGKHGSRSDRIICKKVEHGKVEKWSKKRSVTTYSTLRGPWSLRAYVRRATSAIVES